MRPAEFPVEPRLPDARLADDRDDLAAAHAGLLQRPAQLVQLVAAPHEPRQAPGGRGLKARADRARPHHFVHLDRAVEPLDLSRAQRLHLEVTLRQLERVGGEEDRAGHRHLLHPRRQVGRLPHGRVVHAQIAPDRADDDLAGVEAHADVYGHAGRPVDLVGVLLHALLHPERGVPRPDRVILVRHRRPEQRHDPVTHDLVDGAFVPVDGLHHPLEDGVEELPRLLGVPIREELHRALEVGEEHGHLLPLTLQRAL